MATWKLVVFIWYAETYTYFDWFFPINMYVYDATIPNILLVYHIIKTFVNHSSPSRDLQTFPCSPYSPRGLLRRYTDKKCIIYLKCLWITLLQVVIYKLFPCSPYSPRGLLRRYTDKKCIIYLKCLWITLLQVVIYKLFRVLLTALVANYVGTLIINYVGTLIKNVSYT